MSVATSLRTRLGRFVGGRALWRCMQPPTSVCVWLDASMQTAKSFSLECYS